MRFLALHAALFTVVAALLIAPAASAKITPGVYFLKDGDTGPVGDGVLSEDVPVSENGSVRVILPGQEEVLPLRFALPANATAGTQLVGSAIVGLWLEDTTLLVGNVTATLYKVSASGEESLARASIALDTDPSQLPDPTQVIPPDPTDPEAALAYVTGQALMYVVQPPVVLDMGQVSASFEEGDSIALGLTVDGGPSGLPTGLGPAVLRYDGLLNPSFLVTYWYEEDPPASSDGQATGGSEGSSGSGIPGNDSSDDGPGDGAAPDDGLPDGNQVNYGAEKESPGFAPLALLAAFVGVALWRRDRR